MRTCNSKKKSFIILQYCIYIICIKTYEIKYIFIGISILYKTKFKFISIPKIRYNLRGGSIYMNNVLSKKGFTDSLIGFFIGIMVVVIVAVSVVIPVIQTQVSSYATSENASTVVVTLLNLLPLFIVLAILILVVGLMRF